MLCDATLCSSTVFIQALEVKKNISGKCIVILEDGLFCLRKCLIFFIYFLYNILDYAMKFGGENFSIVSLSPLHVFLGKDKVRHPLAL
jgi:hypothetical protein